MSHPRLVISDHCTVLLLACCQNSSRRLSIAAAVGTAMAMTFLCLS